MKYITFLILCLLSITVTAQTVNYNVDRAAAKNVSLYSLDAGQASAYKEIVRTKLKAYNAATSKKDKTKDYAAIAKADEAYNVSFEAILNDEQKEIFKIQQKMAEDIKAKHLIIPQNQTIQTSPAVPNKK